MEIRRVCKRSDGLEPSLVVMVAAYDHHMLGSSCQLHEGTVDDLFRLRCGRGGIEQIACNEHNLGPGVAGELDDLGQDGPVFVSAASPANRLSDVPVGRVEDT